MAFFRKQTYETLSQLVMGCQQQQAKAQTLFYERYKSRMLGVCIRYARTLAEAEDIFQEAFVKVFQHIHELQKPEAADSWVRSVVVRTAINYFNRTTRQEERLTNFEEIQDELVSDDYELLLSQHASEALLALLNQLPDLYRIVANLYLIEGYTHAQIGELLGIPPATVRSQYNRAKHLLIKKSQQNGIEWHEFLG